MRTWLGTQSTTTSTELWFTYVRAGQAFTLGAQQAAVAAQNTHIQLRNPVGSGKQVLVRSVVIAVGVATTLHLRRLDAALATDVGAGVNLLINAAAGVAHVFQGTNAGLLGTFINMMADIANNPFDFAPAWLCELSPGQGVVIADTVVNQPDTTSFYWVEV